MDRKRKEYIKKENGEGKLSVAATSVTGVRFNVAGVTGVAYYDGIVVVVIVAMVERKKSVAVTGGVVGVGFGVTGVLKGDDGVVVVNRKKKTEEEN